MDSINGFEEPTHHYPIPTERGYHQERSLSRLRELEGHFPFQPMPPQANRRGPQASNEPRPDSDLEILPRTGQNVRSDAAKLPSPEAANFKRQQSPHGYRGQQLSSQQPTLIGGHHETAPKSSMAFNSQSDAAPDMLQGQRPRVYEPYAQPTRYALFHSFQGFDGSNNDWMSPEEHGNYEEVQSPFHNVHGETQLHQTSGDLQTTTLAPQEQGLPPAYHHGLEYEDENSGQNDNDQSTISQPQKHRKRPKPPKPESLLAIVGAPKYTASVGNRTFPGQFQSLQDFSRRVTRREADRLVKSVQPDSVERPIPEEEARGYVQSLFEALMYVDADVTIDLQGQAAKSILAGVYPAWWVESQCWQILNSALYAQIKVRNCESYEGRKFEEYDKLEQRLQVLVDCMVMSKSFCKSILDSNFISRAVDAPWTELLMKHSNKGVNEKRDAQVKLGNAVLVKARKGEAVDAEILKTAAENLSQAQDLEKYISARNRPRKKAAATAARKGGKVKGKGEGKKGNKTSAKTLKRAAKRKAPTS